MKRLTSIIQTLILVVLSYVFIELTIYGFEDAVMNGFYAVGGAIGSVCFVVWLIAHLHILAHIGYNYHQIVAEREAINDTLLDLRQHKRDLEKATIAKKIIKFNTNLAELQTDLKFWYYGQYIDDRIADIEPIL